MPTLLQINTVINSRSTGRIAEEIGQTAMAEGWQSYIAYGRDDRPSKSNKIRIGTDFDLKLHGIKTRLFDKHGFGSTRATKALIKKIKEIKPDIIHLHNIHGYYLNIKILFNFLSTANIPVVWTMHDCWAITGHCVYFSYIDCEKWQTHCEKCPQKNTYPSSFFKDNSYNNFESKQKLFTSVNKMTLVPVSQWLKDILKESFLQEYPMQIINNGINLETFFPQNNNEDAKTKYNLNNKFILLGVASDWISRKGLNDFINFSSFLETDEIIILVGVSEKQKESFPDNILGIERTENIKELTQLYSAADIYLNLTWEDNFPTTNLESLACGTPIITYNTGGSIESVNNNVGFVIEQGNLNSLREKVDIIKKNGKSSYSKKCRKETENLYNKKNKFQEYIQLYNELLK